MFFEFIVLSALFVLVMQWLQFNFLNVNFTDLANGDARCNNIISDRSAVKLISWVLDGRIQIKITFGTKLWNQLN